MASFYVQARPDLKTGWRVMKEEYENGKRTQKAVPKPALRALGFTEEMSVEQARARVKELNGRARVERQEQSKLARIAERVERDRLSHNVFIPEDVNQQFLSWLEKNVTGSEIHHERLKIHWATCKRLIIHCQLLPEEFEENKKQIYRYLAMKTYSLDYSKKLIRLLNLYGRFRAKLTQRYYEAIPQPKGHDRELINDSYHDSEGYLGPSEPLTPEDLNYLKQVINPLNWGWMYASLWLGLRPSELDMILEDKTNRFHRVEDQTLWVYQPKLTSIPRHKRWKPISIIFEEQREAVKLVLSKEIKKPLTKTIQKHLVGRYTLYAGRKGFTDLMLERGQGLESIAQWLGHTSIETTWTKYKDRLKVSL